MDIELSGAPVLEEVSLLDDDVSWLFDFIWDFWLETVSCDLETLTDFVFINYFFKFYKIFFFYFIYFFVSQFQVVVCSVVVIVVVVLKSCNFISFHFHFKLKKEIKKKHENKKK